MMMWAYSQAHESGLMLDADSRDLLSGIYDRLAELQSLTFNLNVDLKSKDAGLTERLWRMNPLRLRMAPERPDPKADLDARVALAAKFFSA
jgi:hypothetical protein